MNRAINSRKQMISNNAVLSISARIFQKYINITKSYQMTLIAIQIQMSTLCSDCVISKIGSDAVTILRGSPNKNETPFSSMFDKSQSVTHEQRDLQCIERNEIRKKWWALFALLPKHRYDAILLICNLMMSKTMNNRQIRLVIVSDDIGFVDNCWIYFDFTRSSHLSLGVSFLFSSKKFDVRE